MIIVLMGVTGSGKTTVGKLLADELGWKYYDADDFHSPANVEKMKRGIPLDDADRKPWLESLRDLIRSRLERGENGVLACSALKEKYRAILSSGIMIPLYWVFLQGSFKLIKKRMEERKDHFLPAGLLSSQFDALQIPANCITIDISNSPDKIIEMIIPQIEAKSST